MNVSLLIYHLQRGIVVKIKDGIHWLKKSSWEKHWKKYPWSKTHVTSDFKDRNHTPWKVNMEPKLSKLHPIEKVNHRANHHFELLCSSSAMYSERTIPCYGRPHLHHLRKGLRHRHLRRGYVHWLHVTIHAEIMIVCITICVSIYYISSYLSVNSRMQ